MYSVVEFVCDDSLAVVANSWLLGDNLVAWPKDREIQRLLEANRRPTNGAKLYKVEVLKDGLDLDKAHRLAQKAEHTDHLSSSEPETLGRGMRTKYPRRLTCDSEDDDELQEIRKHTDRRLGPWAVPSAVLRRGELSASNTTLAARNQTRVGMSKEKVGLPFRGNALGEDHYTRHQSHASRQLTSVASSELCFEREAAPSPAASATAEAYKDFLTKIGSDSEIAQETVKHLSTVGGRTSVNITMPFN
nr:unnamed protein product [Spirometra erinaceieuropaei]